jgi:hypothetical protein
MHKFNSPSYMCGLFDHLRLDLGRSTREKLSSLEGSNLVRMSKLLLPGCLSWGGFAVPFLGGVSLILHCNNVISLSFLDSKVIAK